MVLYRITLAPLSKEIWAADPVILTPLYSDNAAFGGLDRKSDRLTRLLLEWGMDWGYFTDLTKSLFIPYLPAQEAVVWRKVKTEGLDLIFFPNSRYLGDFLFQGRVGGVGATPSGGMGPRGLYFS